MMCNNSSANYRLQHATTLRIQKHVSTISSGRCALDLKTRTNTLTLSSAAVSDLMSSPNDGMEDHEAFRCSSSRWIFPTLLASCRQLGHLVFDTCFAFSPGNTFAHSADAKMNPRHSPAIIFSLLMLLLRSSTQEWNLLIIFICYSGICVTNWSINIFRKICNDDSADLCCKTCRSYSCIFSLVDFNLVFKIQTIRCSKFQAPLTEITSPT